MSTTTQAHNQRSGSRGADRDGGQMQGMAYRKLVLAVGIHFVVMLALTYAGVNVVDEIFLNLNRLYMAVLMVSSMVIVMVAVMWKMFANTKINAAIVSIAALVFIATFGALRTEALVGNQQFLRSMIPHHSIAIHTCNNADIDDAETVELCGQIVQSQREEIAQMREILRRLDG
jgi:hypothetical protein